MRLHTYVISFNLRSCALHDLSVAKFVDSLAFSYVVSSGVVDKLSAYLGSVRGEIAANGNAAAFIKNGLLFLNSVTEFLALR